MNLITKQEKNLNTKIQVKEDSVVVDQWLELEREDKAEIVVLSHEMLEEIMEEVELE